jgi:hypothetical protein
LAALGMFPFSAACHLTWWTRSREESMKPFTRLSLLAAFPLLLILSAPLAESLAQAPRGHETVPITMTVGVEGRYGVTPPAIREQQVQVYLREKQMRVTRWTPLDNNFSLAILVDDALPPALGQRIRDTADWVRKLPEDIPVEVAYARYGTIDVLQSFTTEHAAAAQALRLPSGTPGGSIFYSLQTLMKRWPASSRAREILLVSDGIDRLHNGFGYFSPDLQPTIELAQRDHIVIHTLYARAFDFHGRFFYRITRGQSALSMLADSTGGEAYFSGYDTPVSYAPYLQDLSRLFRNQYTLIFQAVPAEQAGFQQVRVRSSVPDVELDAANQIYVPLPKK